MGLTPSRRARASAPPSPPPILDFWDRNARPKEETVQKSSIVPYQNAVIFEERAASEIWRIGVWSQVSLSACEVRWLLAIPAITSLHEQAKGAGTGRSHLPQARRLSWYTAFCYIRLLVQLQPSCTLCVLPLGGWRNWDEYLIVISAVFNSHLWVFRNLLYNEWVIPGKDHERLLVSWYLSCFPLWGT